MLSITIIFLSIGLILLFAVGLGLGFYYGKILGKRVEDISDDQFAQMYQEHRDWVFAGAFALILIIICVYKIYTGGK